MYRTKSSRCIIDLHTKADTLPTANKFTTPLSPSVDDDDEFTVVATGQIKCYLDNRTETTRVRTRITFPDTDLHGI